MCKHVGRHMACVFSTLELPFDQDTGLRIQ